MALVILRSIPTFKIVVNVNCPDHLLVDFLTFKYLMNEITLRRTGQGTIMELSLLTLVASKILEAIPSKLK